MCKRSYDLRCVRRAVLLGSSAALALTGFGEAALAQVQLPQVVVTGAKPKTKPHPVRRHVAAPTATPPAAVAPVNTADVKNNEFDNARTNLYTTMGTNSDTISHDTIQALPQGTNAPVEKVLLQAAGRVAGFRGERLAPRPQRSRQRAVPHQRRDAARRRHRLRQRLGHEPDRQHFADHRCAAGRIRDAHGRPRRHHHPHRHFQQFGQHQFLRR